MYSIGNCFITTEMSDQPFEGSFDCPVCLKSFHRRYGAGCKLHPVCRSGCYSLLLDWNPEVTCVVCRQPFLKPARPGPSAPKPEVIVIDEPEVIIIDDPEKRRNNQAQERAERARRLEERRAQFDGDRFNEVQLEDDEDEDFMYRIRRRRQPAAIVPPQSEFNPRRMPDATMTRQFWLDHYAPAAANPLDAPAQPAAPEPDIAAPAAPPPPEEFIMHSIVGHRQVRIVVSSLDSRCWQKKMFYKVRWRNYQPEEDTWEPSHRIKSKRLITRYLDSIDSSRNRTGGRRGPPPA